MKGQYHYHYVPPLHKLSDALVHYVPSSVLLALIVTALLVVWTHGQSSMLAGLGREARRKYIYVVVALLLTLAMAFFFRIESFFRTLGLSQTADGYVLLTVVFAFTALIFFVLGQSASTYGEGCAELAGDNRRLF